MQALDDPADGAGLLTPARLATLLPSQPILSSPADGWFGVVLQRYLNPQSTLDVPGLRDNLVVDHLVGPVLTEDVRGQHLERRWTNAGQVSVTPVGEPVRRVVMGRPDVVLVHLARELVAEAATGGFDIDPARIELVPDFATPDEKADQIVRMLLAEAEARGHGTRLMTELLGRALAVHLIRYHSNLAPRTPEVASHGHASRILRVMDFMRTHLDEDLSLEQLARVGELGLSQFARAFRDSSGKPPHRFLVELRIERARELLETTLMPVTEVGFKCGFGQPQHFATMFRKLMGVSPRAWRKLRRS